MTTTQKFPLQCNPDRKVDVVTLYMVRALGLNTRAFVMNYAWNPEQEFANEAFAILNQENKKYVCKLDRLIDR